MSDVVCNSPQILHTAGKMSQISRGSPNCSDNDSHSSTKEIIRSIIKHLKRPHFDVTKFDGNPLAYKRFMRQFETMIVANTDNYDEKINYMDQFTSGEPNRIVRSLSYLDAHGGVPCYYSGI